MSQKVQIGMTVKLKNTNRIGVVEQIRHGVQILVDYSKSNWTDGHNGYSISDIESENCKWWHSQNELEIINIPNKYKELMLDA